MRRVLPGMVLATALLAGGCSRGGVRPSTALDAGETPAWRRPHCIELPGRPTPKSSFVFALAHDVDPSNAPVPTNPSEGIVFRLLFETLVDVDCTGARVPGLAEAWEASEDGRTWTFRLRREAWFAHADDEARWPVDASAVRTAWQATRRRLKDAGALPWPWEIVLLRDVTVVDAEHLSVRTAEAMPDLPALLSRMEFAVTRPAPRGSAWSEGTRGVVADPLLGADRRELVWWPESKDGEGPVARITFRVRPGDDARDLAESDVDALVARNRQAVSYLESREDLRVTPHVKRTDYFLLTCHEALASAITPEVRADLAAGATRAISREDRGPGERIAFGDTGAGAPPERVRVAFVPGDPPARALAERLAATLPAAEAVAVPLAPGAFASALRRGDAEAFVIRMPVAPEPTLERVQLAGTAPWLATGGWAVPLLDARESLVTREGLTGVRVGHDGVPRLTGAGWIRGKRP